MQGKREVIVSIIMYSLASASMLLVNKIAMTLLPLPSTIATIQFIFASLSIFVAKTAFKYKVDDFEWFKVKPYLIYVAGFALGCYANMQALAISNVETIIVFRTCAPLAVGILDWLFLGRELPSKRSTCALVLILFGALCYVNADKQFALLGVHAYFWVSFYFLTLCFSMTYGKHLVNSVELESPIWGAVYYTNSLSILPMIGFGIISQENEKLNEIHEIQLISPFIFILIKTTLVIFITCILGTCISYTGFRCRTAISATSYTVVGVMNKILTILANYIMWEQVTLTQFKLHLSST